MFGASGALVEQEGAPCEDMATKYTAANAWSMGAAGAVGFMNVVLRASLIGTVLVLRSFSAHTKLTMFAHAALASFEKHDTLTQKSSSAATKVFLALYMNTAIIALIVNARLPPALDTPALQGTGVFQVHCTALQ